MSDLNLNNLVDGLDDLSNVLQSSLHPPASPPTVSKPTVSLDPVLDYVRTVKFHWLYEARKNNGNDSEWWHFDQDSNEQIESAYVMNEPSLELLIDGKHKVIIHIDTMVQVTKNGSRDLKRVEKLDTVRLKGIAGKHYGSQTFI